MNRWWAAIALSMMLTGPDAAHAAAPAKAPPTLSRLKTLSEKYSRLKKDKHKTKLLDEAALLEEHLQHDPSRVDREVLQYVVRQRNNGPKDSPLASDNLFRKAADELERRIKNKADAVVATHEAPRVKQRSLDDGDDLFRSSWRPSRRSYFDEESSWGSRWSKKPKEPLPYERLAVDKKAHVDRLILQTQRPSLEQFRKLMKDVYGSELPAENPFGSASHITKSEREIADMIAQLERAYPGGTYLPLGRDAVAIADVLSAFYTANGQPDRARRLDMSGTSLPHYRDANERTFTEDRQIIHDFLASNGLDLDHIDKQKGPFVMVDVTSYGRTSQSTQLMRSVYRSWSMSGRDPKALTDKVAFVGLPGGDPDQTLITETHDLEATKARMKRDTSNDGPHDILYLGGDLHPLTYTTAWHSDFEPFDRAADGKVTSAPGRQHGESDKLEVLAEMYEITRLMSKPEMLRAVKDAAANHYGYEFPSQRVSEIKRIAGPARVKDATPSASSSQGRSTYLAALADKMREPTVGRAYEFLNDLAGMFTRGTIPKDDLREAVRTINAKVWIDGRELGDRLEEVYQRNPGFRDAVRKALK
jgi:hypothetical protein